MDYKQKGLKAVGLFAAVATSMALIVPTVKSQSKTIKIDGSSTVYPITEAVAEEYQIANKGATQVTVGISGTGGGFKKFCSADDSVRTDISDASRPIKDKEKEMCAAAGVEYIEIPVAYDAIAQRQASPDHAVPASLIAVVVNKNNPISSITTEQLNTIWAPEADGQVTNWSQVDPSWENAEMTLYGPGADSGTFDYFTKKINGESGASRADYTPSEDDNVLVQGVVGDEGAMGYFGLSYYFENQDQLKALAIDSGNGPVAPSPETVIDGTYTPLSRPIFIYVNKASLEKPEVAEFVQFYLENAEELVPETGSVPLPATGSGLSYQSSMAVLKSSL